MIKMNRSLTLPLLYAFVEVAEKRSMVRASEALNITQPAVSMQLARLTEIVGHKLFCDTKTYELTDVGHQVLQEAKLALDAAHNICEMGVRSSTPHINIGFSIDAFEFCQQTVIKEFSRDHLMKIHCLSSGETLDAARDGRLDVAVVFLPPDYRGPSIVEISCRLVLSTGTGPRQSSSDDTSSPLKLAMYGPRCPYRCTTVQFLTSNAIPFSHELEATSPTGLHQLIASLGAQAPFPLFLRASRYFSMPYTTIPTLPDIRLGVLANNTSFRRLHFSKLSRIATELRQKVSEVESVQRASDRSSSHPSARPMISTYE